MKAITRTRYGGPDELRLEEIDKPSSGAGQVLVRVLANSANPLDSKILRGKPFFLRMSYGLFRPREKVLGVDFVGSVETCGEGVDHFKPGDLVYGESLRGGAFAEFVAVPADACSKVPAGVESGSAHFAEFAGLPVAGLAALQALVTHGKLKKGESVLINGSSGGVGHLAVQIAKHYGARVSAVCSSAKADFVRSLGADDVIAYDQDDIHQHEKTYDLIFDTHGNLQYEDFKRMGRRATLIAFTDITASVLMQSAKAKYPLTQFTAKPDRADLDTLASLLQSKSIRVHIEKTYPYNEIPDAISYIEKMHTQGKVVMTWGKG